MKNKNNITLSTKVVEDFIWMSLRYCIGRHTGAAICHANTIKQVIRDNPNAFSSDSIKRIADDIRREINMVLNGPMNVVMDAYSDLDLFSPLFYSLEENEDTTKYVYTIHEKTGQVLREIRIDKPIHKWESFENLYSDLISKDLYYNYEAMYSTEEN